jgi:hypothetical protein
MTAKDKAKELVDRFRIGDRNMKSKAKQCALICVDEIINTYPSPWSSLDVDPQKDYWEEVKQEIYKI